MKLISWDIVALMFSVGRHLFPPLKQFEEVSRTVLKFCLWNRGSELVFFSKGKVLSLQVEDVHDCVFPHTTHSHVPLHVPGLQQNSHLLQVFIQLFYLLLSQLFTQLCHYLRITQGFPWPPSDFLNHSHGGCGNIEGGCRERILVVFSKHVRAILQPLEYGK